MFRKLLQLVRPLKRLTAGTQTKKSGQSRRPDKIRRQHTPPLWAALPIIGALSALSLWWLYRRSFNQPQAETDDEEPTR